MRFEPTGFLTPPKSFEKKGGIVREKRLGGESEISKRK